MNTPPKEKSHEAYKSLQKQFDDLFKDPLKIGKIYSF